MNSLTLNNINESHEEDDEVERERNRQLKKVKFYNEID